MRDRATKKPFAPQAFFATEQAATAQEIVEWFVLRWNEEVTFEEVRASGRGNAAAVVGEGDCAHDPSAVGHVLADHAAGLSVVSGSADAGAHGSIAGRDTLRREPKASRDDGA